MQEISPQVFIETGYAGVTLGAINLAHGLILIDAPFRQEDIRSWRSALLNLGGGVERLLINMDSHPDRLLGTRSMECPVLTHDDLAVAYQNRTMALKNPNNDTGAEWERYDNLGSIRWSMPEITFTDEMTIHWDDEPVILETAPGCAIGSLWIHLPVQRILFLGDLVVPAQPPFLVNSNLPAWINTLQKLSTPAFQDYLFISGRGGLVRMDMVRKQVAFLEKTRDLLEKMARNGSGPEEIEGIISTLMAEFRTQPDREAQFRSRLIWGLTRYYTEHYYSTESFSAESH